MVNGTTDVSGDRTLADIAAIISKNRDKFRACYDNTQRVNTGIRGKYILLFELKPSGELKSASVDEKNSEIKDPAMDRCSITELQKLTFPPSRQGKETKVSYPFTFTPGGAAPVKLASQQVSEKRRPMSSTTPGTGVAPMGTSVLDSLRFFAATDVGRVRAHNEDNFLVDSRLGLFVVADGMGGHAAGEIASALAVRQLHDILCESSDTLTRFTKGEVSAKEILALLSTAVQRASSRIHEQALSDGSKRGMGTTLSALLFLGDRGFVAHVGDSRIYLLRNGRISQITDDHTVINELVKRGKLTREQIDRVAQKNAITRAVGVYERVEVDTLLVETAPGDAFLLCSDGLHGYFNAEEDLIPYLEESMGEQCAAAIVAVANDRGGKDNITAVIVRLEGGHDGEAAARAKKLETKQRILGKMPLFTRLSKRELLRVMQIADVVSYRDGEYIVREGQVGDELFVVLSGQVKVSAKDVYLTTLGAGDHLGELALLRNAPRNMTATSDGPSELVRFRRHDFFDILRTEPELSVKLLWQFLGVIADRLDQTTTDLGKAREQLDTEDMTEEVF